MSQASIGAGSTRRVAFFIWAAILSLGVWPALHRSDGAHHRDVVGEPECSHHPCE